MRQLSWIALICCLLSFTSCIDIVEELWLNKNGSGKYTMTIDMSSLMSAEMRDLFKGLQDADEDADSDNPLTSDEPVEMDSIAYLSDAPDSIRQQIDRPELLDKMYMRTQVSSANEKMLITMGIDFDKLEDVNYFMNNLDKLKSGNQLDDGLGGGSDMLGLGGSDTQQDLFKMSGKRTLTRLNPPKKDREEASEEDLGMAKMMFGDAKYTLIYHLPGKVKSVSNPEAQIVDKKTVKMEIPFMDMLEEKADFSNTIKYKRR